MLICKLLELAHDLVVAGVAVRFAAHFPDFLHGVDDDEIGVRMFSHKILQLLVQTVPDFSGGSGKVQIGGIVHAIHHKHPVLDALEVILQRKVKDCSLVDFAAPQRLPGADMVGDLRHQKRLADLGRTGKKVCPRMEQIFNDGWAAFVGSLKQLGHGERVQVARVSHTLHLTVHFLQIFHFPVAFCLRSGYTVVRFFLNGLPSICANRCAQGGLFFCVNSHRQLPPAFRS